MTSPAPSIPRPKIKSDGHTSDGANVGSSPSIAPPKVGFWETNDFKNGVTFCVITACFALVGYAFQIIVDYHSFKGKTEEQLTNLKEKIKEIDTRFSPENNKKNVPPNKENPNTPQKDEIIATIGLMAPNIKNSHKTSFGFDYITGYNDCFLCEANEMYDWQAAGIDSPVARDVYELSNPVNKFKSWCFVIGKIKNENEKHCAFIVSHKVMNSLLDESVKDKKSASISFRKMDGSEIDSNKDLKLLRDKHFR
jgi:hypothetical protein